MKAPSGRAALLICLACLASWAARLAYADRGAMFVAFYTRFDNPGLTWVTDQSDFSQLLPHLEPWFWKWLPSYGVSALLFLVLLRWTGSLRKGGEKPGSWASRLDRAFPYWACLAFVLLATVRLGMFPPPNFATDERAYHFQADLLLQGRLRAPAPDYPDAFQSAGVYCKDFWTSSYQPGWPAALALGKLAHADALVNCVWWLACLILVRRLARRLWGEAEGVWASLLFAFSSCFWFAAWSDFTHLQTTALSLLSWELFLSFLNADQGSRGRACAVLLCWAGVAVTRVQDYPTALAVPTAWILLGILGKLSATRRRLQAGLGLLVLGGLSSVALVLLVNCWQTGHPLQLPFILYAGPQSVFPHSLWRALFNLVYYLFRIGWWLPPFFLGLLLLRRPQSWDWGLVLGILSQVAFYACFYSNAGGEWGARFYTISITVACLLGGAACPRLPRDKWAVGGLALALLTLATAGQVSRQAYVYYEQGSRNSHRLAQVLRTAPTLLFVRRIPQKWELAAMVANHPDFTPPVTAIWLDPEQNEAIRQRFPACRCLVLDVDDSERPTLAAYPEPAQVFSSGSYYQAGKNYLALENPQKALACLKRSLPSETPAGTYTVIGFLERDLGRFEEAAESLRQALQYDPAAANTRLAYIRLLRQLKRDRDAEEQEKLLPATPAPPSGG